MFLYLQGFRTNVIFKIVAGSENISQIVIFLYSPYSFLIANKNNFQYLLWCLSRVICLFVRRVEANGGH